MHHKTSDAVEIQDNEFPENPRKKEIGKIIQEFRTIGKVQKITDEFRGFFIFLLRFNFSDRDMTLCSWEKESVHRLLQCRTFLCRKKLEAQRKDFGGRYGFLVFIGFLYPPPTWKVLL